MGKPKRTSLDRRSFLKMGALGVGGLTLADLLRVRAQDESQMQSGRRFQQVVYIAARPTEETHILLTQDRFTDQPGGSPRAHCTWLVAAVPS